MNIIIFEPIYDSINRYITWWIRAWDKWALRHKEFGVLKLNKTGIFICTFCRQLNFRTILVRDLIYYDNCLSRLILLFPVFISRASVRLPFPILVLAFHPNAKLYTQYSCTVRYSTYYWGPCPYWNSSSVRKYGKWCMVLICPYVFLHLKI